MKNFTIADNYIEITEKNKQHLRLDYKEIKSVKIIYYYTFFQKIINLLPKVNKKNYTMSIHLKNHDKFKFEISSDEKEEIKPKLELIKKNIEKADKVNVKDNTVPLFV